MLPKKYFPVLSPLIASYDHNDLAEGTGIVDFLGYTNTKSTGEQYGLTTNTALFSQSLSGSSAITVGGPFELDFDSAPLNKPLVIKGTAIFNMTWKVLNSSGSNSNYPFVYLRKWDGSTETDIGFVSGSIVDLNSVAKTSCLKISGISPTLIKIGEQIRVTYGVDASTAGNSPVAHISFDPQGSTTGFGGITSKLIAHLPFRIAQ